MTFSHTAPLIVLIPLTTAFIILFLGARAYLFARRAALAATGITLVLAMLLAYQVGDNQAVTYHFGSWPPPLGIEFLIDRVSAFFLLLVAGSGHLVIWFASGILAREIRQSIIANYYALFLILLASLLGIASSNDIFNIYVFLEISSISAAALVAVNGNKLAVEASFKYLVLSTLGSGTVLLSIASLYMVTGYLNLTAIAEQIDAAYAAYPLNILAALGLLVVGLAVKAALYPLHVWLPDAHGAAPTASSAILSGLVVKVYIIVFLKLIFRVFPSIFFAMPPLQISLLVMSVLSIILGSVQAIRQTDLKKMLAYSTVAQIGYIFLGLGLFTHYGILGALLHILNHAMMKVMLFLSAGLIIKSTGIHTIRGLAGMGRHYPIPMVAFSFGALSMVGVPPLNGFISKWYLGLGALEAEQPVFALVILVSSFLNALYYFPIVISSFFDTGYEGIPEPVPSRVYWVLILLCCAIVFFGLFSRFPVAYLEPAIEAVFSR